MRNRTWFAPVLVVALLPALASAMATRYPRADFFVAADGNDRQPGTRGRPFATVTRAQQAVRGRIAAGLRADVTVLVRGGVYALAEPLTFGPEDSGTPEHSVTYAAYPGETVVLSGGTRISGWQREGTGGVWSADVPVAAPADREFRQLFVDGRRAVRARTPNADDQWPYWQIADETLSPDLKTHVLRLGAGRVEAWTDPAAIELVVLGNWETTRKRLAGVEVAANSLILAPPHLPQREAPWNWPDAGRWCFAENAPEFFDAPGEWCLDRTRGKVRYRPLPQQAMPPKEAFAPRLSRLLAVAGTAQRPVVNLHFRGLNFAHADWPLPAGGYYGSQANFYHTGAPQPPYPRGRIDAALRWAYARQCSLEDGEVSGLGGAGIVVEDGCEDVVIQGNHVHELGGSGIEVGCPHDGSLAPRRCRVLDNYVHACGLDYYGAVGIWVGFAEGTEVAHNQLCDLPYTGISVGWQWNPLPTACRTNVIEANHIFDVMQRLADGGGIYTLGFQPGTVLRGNLIHDVRRSAFAQGSPNNGFFIDEGSKGYLIESNVVYNTSGEPVRHNQNQPDWHTWRDNLFVPNPPASAGAAGTPAGQGTNSPAIHERILQAAAKAGLEPRYRARWQR